MTKKDYELIASVLRDALVNNWKWYMIRNCMANKLAEKNPRFDIVKFLEACEPGKEVSQ